MENPYYEIISLFRGLAGRQAEAFCAEIGLDDENKPVILLGGQVLDGQFWTPCELEISERDEGAAVLCVPFDRGFLILTKLAQL